MVSKKDITDLDFDDIQEYYNYIVESYINGQPSQCKTLVKKLSGIQYAHLQQWLFGNGLENYIDIVNKYKFSI